VSGRAALQVRVTASVLQSLWVQWRLGFSHKGAIYITSDPDYALTWAQSAVGLTGAAAQGDPRGRRLDEAGWPPA
jgi:hypothetical protein